MSDSLKFFSILNRGDSKYKRISDNFTFHLKKAGVELPHHLIKVEGKTASFNSPRFNKIAMHKLLYASEFLKEGETVFCSDLDVVFLKDPINYLMSLLNDYDILFQGDPWLCLPGALPICTGFFLAKPSPLCADFFNPREKVDFLAWPEREKNGAGFVDYSDQGYIRSKLKLNPQRYGKLKIKILDRSLFPIRFSRGGRCSNPYIMHYAGGPKGFRSKIKTMRGDGRWGIFQDP